MPRPPELHADQLEEVVHQALVGKYPVADKFLREETIRPLLERLWQLPLDRIPDAAGDVRDVEDDARNQITTLIRLERDWATRPVADIDIATIHRAVCGNGSQSTSLRKTEYVEDFDAEPPTRLVDLQDRQDTINRSLFGIDALLSESEERKADFLAGLFSSIIGAHVFADGNGRVARIAVQYCLRRWSMDFVALPKVRNAPGWKRVLHAAIAGDRTGLATYMHRLIRKETVEAVERSFAERE